MLRVASFDIFDTCLTRNFAHPMDLFLEVGEIAVKKSWIAIAPQEFVARRRAAEDEARKLAPFREVSLEQIYQQLGLALGLAPNIVLEIQNTELLLEAQSLQPIHGTRRRIVEARRQGRQILFLSDMYLSASFLMGLLKKHGFYEEGDFLYVSGEVGRHKADGGLFQHAREQLKNEITEWLHLGDNPRADVEAARRLGLDAEHFTAGMLNRYELLICPTIRYRHRLKARVLAATRLDVVGKVFGVRPQKLHREHWQSRLVAAMRLARLAKPHDLSPQQQIIWDTGANIAGPLFYGYVKWTLAQAAKKNLSRLYFVARDGQILLKIAQVIQSFRPTPIECHYLYGSRHAWLPASLREIDASHLRWILAPTPGLSIRDVFLRLDIAPEKYQSLLESSGFPASAWEKAINLPQVARLTELLLKPELSAEIKTIAAAKREDLLQYLRREGVFAQPQIGLVDLGWRGSLKEALTAVCAQAPDPIKPRVHGLYLALVESAQQRDESFCGYVNAHRPGALGSFLFSMQMLEAFAAADHGQTRGYRDGQPILSSPDNSAVTQWGLPALQGGTLAFCQAYGAVDDRVSPPDAYLDATLSILRFFYENPALDEVNAWGSFPFSDQQVETDLSALLPPWDRSQTLAALWTKDGRKRLWWAPALAQRENMASLLLYYRLQKLWRTRLKPGAK